MRPLLSALLLPAMMIGLGGCASFSSGFMEGYTSLEARNNYFLVGKDDSSFGYRQMKYVTGYRPRIKGFVEGHGPPDFIYQYAADERRTGFRLYYVNSNMVYVFEESNRDPNSIALKEERQFTEDEQRVYARLTSPAVFGPATVQGATLSTGESEILKLMQHNYAIWPEVADQSPKMLEQATPVYPPSLTEQKIDGVANARFIVDETGRVEKVEIINATHPDFGSATASALLLCRFQPMTRQGVPVKVVFEQKFQFLF